MPPKDLFQSASKGSLDDNFDFQLLRSYTANGEIKTKEQKERALNSFICHNPHITRQLDKDALEWRRKVLLQRIKQGAISVRPAPPSKQTHRPAVKQNFQAPVAPSAAPRATAGGMNVAPAQQPYRTIMPVARPHEAHHNVQQGVTTLAAASPQANRMSTSQLRHVPPHLRKSNKAYGPSGPLVDVTSTTVNAQGGPASSHHTPSYWEDGSDLIELAMVLTAAVPATENDEVVVRNVAGVPTASATTSKPAPAVTAQYSLLDETSAEIQRLTNN